MPVPERGPRPASAGRVGIRLFIGLVPPTSLGDFLSGSRRCFVSTLHRRGRCACCSAEITVRGGGNPCPRCAVFTCVAFRRDRGHWFPNRHVSHVTSLSMRRHSGRAVALLSLGGDGSRLDRWTSPRAHPHEYDDRSASRDVAAAAPARGWPDVSASSAQDVGVFGGQR